eukprot:scaffold625450_cov18-Prasinocladus_malaysianus.AAC.1
MKVIKLAAARMIVKVCNSSIDVDKWAVGGCRMHKESTQHIASRPDVIVHSPVARAALLGAW